MFLLLFIISGFKIAALDLSAEVAHEVGYVTTSTRKGYRSDLSLDPN